MGRPQPQHTRPHWGSDPAPEPPPDRYHEQGFTTGLAVVLLVLLVVLMTWSAGRHPFVQVPAAMVISLWADR